MDGRISTSSEDNMGKSKVVVIGNEHCDIVLTVSHNDDLDLDLSVFLLGENNTVTSDVDFIFYNNLVHPSGGVMILGGFPERTRPQEEMVHVSLDRVPINVSKLVFTITTYEEETENLSFGQASNVYFRIDDESTNVELMRYDLGEDSSIETTVVVGELYRSGDEWKFNAIGSGFQGGLQALCAHYGIDAE